MEMEIYITWNEWQVDVTVYDKSMCHLQASERNEEARRVWMTMKCWISSSKKIFEGENLKICQF